MKNENDQPNDEREYTSGKSNKHEPTQHAERIKKVSIILSIDDAGMHRAFIDFASICASD